jgi:hypothetical protein
VEVQNVLHYAKFLIPLVTAGITAYQTVFGQGNWLFVTLSIAVAIVQAFGVLMVPNADDGFFKYSKLWVGVLGVIAQLLLGYVGADGNLSNVTSVQWSTIALAVIAALGTATVPNDTKTSLKLVSTGQPIVPSAPLVPIQPISNIQPADFGPITFPDEEKKTPPAKKTTSAKIVVKDVPLPKKSPGTGV